MPPSLEELISRYLDKYYPIDERIVTMGMLYMALRIRPKAFESKQFPWGHNSIDLDVMDIFGVNPDHYFWNWVESRIDSEYVILDFLDKQVTYHNKKAIETKIFPRHYKYYEEGDEEYDEDAEDFYDYYDDEDEQYY